MRAFTCKHFTGVQHSACKVDVGYEQFRVEGKSMLATLPCFGDCDGCDKREYPTTEEIAAYESEVDRSMQPLLCIDEQVNAGQTFGSFTHHGCGGTITWRVEGPLAGGAKCDKCDWRMQS